MTSILLLSGKVGVKVGLRKLSGYFTFGIDKSGGPPGGVLANHILPWFPLQDSLVPKDDSYSDWVHLRLKKAKFSLAM